MQLCTVLGGMGVVVQARLSHVEAGGRGLRIVEPPSSDRIIAWHDIAEVRRVPPAVGSSKFGVALTGGEIVDLRLSVDDRPEFVERWWLETDRRQPDTSGIGNGPPAGAQ